MGMGQGGWVDILYMCRVWGNKKKIKSGTLFCKSTFKCLSDSV